MSALLALLALSRFPSSGAAIECVSPGGATEQHRHSSVTVTGAAAHDHDVADGNGDTDCGNSQHAGCPSMSSCATAVLPDASVLASDISAAHRVVVGLSKRLFDLPRAPEPPPPRA